METVFGEVERALAALREARRRGRPVEQDQALAAEGYLPVSIASAILRKRGGTLYKARDQRRLVMRQVRGFYYVHRSEVLRYATTPVRLGRPPLGGSDAR